MWCIGSIVLFQNLLDQCLSRELFKVQEIYTSDAIWSMKRVYNELWCCHVRDNYISVYSLELQKLRQISGEGATSVAELSPEQVVISSLLGLFTSDHAGKFTEYVLNLNCAQTTMLE